MPISASELENSKPAEENILKTSDIISGSSCKLLAEEKASKLSDNPDLSLPEIVQFFDANELPSTIKQSPMLTIEEVDVEKEEGQDCRTEGEQKKKRQGVYYSHPYSLVGLTQLDAILPLSASHSPISYKEQLTQVGLIKFQDSYSDQEEDEFKNKPKAHKLMIIAMLVVIMLLSGSLIPSLFFSIRGSSLAFWNHFRSLTPINKARVTSEITNFPVVYPLNESPIQSQTHIFKGVAYLPTVTQNDRCVYTWENAIQDIVQLSQVTNKIRTYNTRCQTIDFLVEAIERFNLDMKITLGIWLSNDERENELQIEDAKRILRKYHPRHFNYILVGNEVLFRNDLSQSVLIGHINDLRRFLQTIEVSIPVGTSEISDRINKDLIQEVQVIGINVHPFLTGLEPQNASRWVAESLLPSLKSLNEFNTQLIITEIGWPYDGEISSLTSETLQVQEFMDAWICHDGAGNDTIWYYFEAFDQPMRKRKFYGLDNEWEADWGIFGVDGRLKPGSTLPKCHH